MNVNIKAGIIDFFVSTGIVIVLIICANLILWLFHFHWHISSWLLGWSFAVICCMIRDDLIIPKIAAYKKKEINKSTVARQSLPLLTTGSILTSGRLEVPCSANGKGVVIVLEVRKGKLAGISLAN
jgi:hypothetical protein